MKIYYVEGYAGWFVIRANSKRRAFSMGVREFGRGRVKEVRAATPEDIKSYAAQKGRSDIDEAD